MMRTKNEIDKMSQARSAVEKKFSAKYFPDLDFFSRFGTTLLYGPLQKIHVSRRVAPRATANEEQTETCGDGKVLVLCVLA
jgi:hypothetical protein